MIRSTPALFNALKSIPVLAGIDLPALTLLAEEGIVHDFAPGTWIVQEGEEGHSFFILVEGHVEIVKHADTPRAVMLAVLHQGTFFGEMCVIEPRARMASVHALTPVRAIEIKAATLHHLSKQMPDQYTIILLNLARDLVRRLRDIDEIFAARSS
jgi:CRP-like cAMP-binding protein